MFDLQVDAILAIAAFPAFDLRSGGVAPKASPRYTSAVYYPPHPHTSSPLGISTYRLIDG